MLIYIKHNQINKVQWDACIAKASNGIVYAYSWYLDVVSPNWDALVMNDYEYVMPLPVKKRFCFKYVVRPPLCQQLGIFSQEKISRDIINEFFSALNFGYVFLSVNNEIKLSQKNLTVTESPNFILPLSKKYEELEKSFTDNTRRNIRKAKKNKVEIRAVSAEEYFLFVQKYIKGVNQSFHSVLSELVTVCLSKKACELWGAYSKEGELLAATFFLVSSNRYINLVPSSSPEGLEKSAMFLLISSFIKEHAQSNSVLDFEGSKIEGIARFFRGYGAENQAYFNIQKMRFPALFALIKYFKRN